MEKDKDILKDAEHYKFKPYSMRIVGEYRHGSMPWFGICGRKVEIWGLYYEECEIYRSGKNGVETMMGIANGAYNNGIIDALKKIKL